VVGINGTKEAVDAIISGRLLASGDYNGFLQGCIAAMTAIRFLRHQSIVPDMVLKPMVIDSSNAHSYDTPVDARSCPSWEQAIAH
jgi:ribose transport system substrate-binding protein